MTSPASSSTEEWPEFVNAVAAALEANRLAKEHVSGTKKFRSSAWEFARRLKAHPMLMDLPAEGAAELIDEALQEIFPDVESALLWEQTLGTEDTKGGDSDPFLNFLNSWAECQKPGAGVLEDAFERAMANPRPLDYFGGLFKGPRYANFRKLLTTAEELQRVQGDENILLPEKALAALMGLKHHQTISDLRKLAERHGFLVQRAEHKPFVLAIEFTYHPPGEDSLAPEKQENQEKQDKQAPSTRSTREPSTR